MPQQAGPPPHSEATADMGSFFFGSLGSVQSWSRQYRIQKERSEATSSSGQDAKGQKLHLHSAEESLIQCLAWSPEEAVGLQKNSLFSRSPPPTFFDYCGGHMVPEWGVSNSRGPAQD